MKKRISSILLVLCMLCSLLTITAAAEQTASFSVSAASTVNVGDTFTVSVTLSTIENGRSFECHLGYDASLVEYVSHSSAYVDYHSGSTVSVANATMKPETLGGTILSVEFKALAEGTATFSLSGCKAGAGEVAAAIGTSSSGASVVIEVPHVCAPELVEEEPASCTATGVKAHYACECGKLYSDAEGKNEVTADSLVIPKKAHSYVDGECEHCGAKEPSGPVINPVDPTPDDEEEEKDPTFIDVLPGSYYYEAVEWAVANGITNGITADTFCPDMICTRAQMVTFLWRAAGKPQAETAEMPFTDVSEGAYYYDAVLWAVENGITNGTSATTFSPNAEVTRAQTVTFLWRMQNQPEADGEMIFTDVKQDAYYAEAVLWAVEAGITNGTSATTFSPEDGCTRAQIVTFLWRCLK